VNPTDTPVGDLIDHLFRHKAGQMVSTLTRIFGPDHLELAEDVVQESLLQALQQWPYRGIPDNPSAWIVAVAKNRALNVLRREALFRDKAPAFLGEPGPGPAAVAELALDDPLGDDQLAMMFMCCYPGLAPDAQVALMLKTVGGFSVEEIAAAFLQPTATIAQRLVRAKRRLREEAVAFALPPPDVLPARLDAVLAALYLLFNEGYDAHHGEELVRSDLCAEAVRLTTLLAEHALTCQPKVHALLALMLLQGSRLAARLDPTGRLLRLAEQDRARWDREAIRAGLYHLDQAGTGDELTEYHLQAGIAACHAVAASEAETDWSTILMYYDALVARNPSPILALNRAVALAMVAGPRAGLAALEAIEAQAQLQDYYLLPASLAEMHERLGDSARAAVYYRAALRLTHNAAERRFLEVQLAACGG
jgi:RNA polymerase sigma factor (sigma-70 family)